VSLFAKLKQMPGQGDEHPIRENVQALKDLSSSRNRRGGTQDRPEEGPAQLLPRSKTMAASSLLLTAQSLKQFVTDAAYRRRLSGWSITSTSSKTNCVKFVKTSRGAIIASCQSSPMANSKSAAHLPVAVALIAHTDSRLDSTPCVDSSARIRQQRRDDR